MVETLLISHVLTSHSHIPVVLIYLEPMEEESEEEPMDEEQEVPSEDPPEPGDWAVWITTGSNEGAETVNPVYLSVYGEDNVFRNMELNKENYTKLKEETDKNVKKKVLFDRGSTDEYKVGKFKKYILVLLHLLSVNYVAKTLPVSKL